ncbi:hypothetical protein [Burkholderia multivorans]|nr:hypothetical protein V1241_28340 [Burkholderia multivorans]
MIDAAQADFRELSEETIDRAMSMSDADITAVVFSGPLKLPQR